MNRFTFAIFLGLWAYVVPTTAADLSAFRYYKPIAVDSSAEILLRSTLDSDLFAVTKIGYGDIRIFDADGHERPYLIEKATVMRTKKTKHQYAAKVIRLAEIGNQIELVVESRASSLPVQGIYLQTPLTDFERRINVFGQAGGVWKQIISDALVFDYRRYIDLSENEIPLPNTPYRRFKLVIHEVNDEQTASLLALSRTFSGGEEVQRVLNNQVERRPFRIDSIGFWGFAKKRQTKAAKNKTYAMPSFEVKTTAKTTEITIQTQREPLTSFTLSSTSRNFHRRCVVQVPDPKTHWRTLATGSLSKLAFKALRRERMKLRFPEQRSARYRIVVYNEDNAPLAISQVQASGPRYQIVTLTQGNSRLYYGATISPPSYDAAKVIAPVRARYPAQEVALGAQTKNAQYQQEIEVVSWLNSPLILWIAIALMVAVMAWGLVVAARRVTDEDPEKQ